MGSSESKPAIPQFDIPTTDYPAEPPADAYDDLQAMLPQIVDDETRQLVEDFKQACNNGKGPMAACYGQAEYMTVFELKHRAAASLYHNVCFRPPTDPSPNGVLVDGTKSWPAGCFNLAKLFITGKAGIKEDRVRGYELVDRACRGGHGAACYLQAQILTAPPGEYSDQIKRDPYKAMKLLEQNCHMSDSVSCFALATMLLRGENVSNHADNVTPQEARGLVPLAQRENEDDRARLPGEYVIPRDPQRALRLLEQACEQGSHGASCYNLAVMYTQGDDGVPADPEKAAHFRKVTEEKIAMFGGFE